MKRILLAIALLAAALFTSCNKETNPDAPTIEWSANPKFGTQELSVGADGNITLTAPGKIQYLSLSLNLGSMYNAQANNYISVDANKYPTAKNPVLDVIDDAKAAAFLASLGIQAGESLRGKVTTQIDIIKLFDGLMGNMAIENNSNFSIDITLVDQTEVLVTKTVKLHFTSGPEVKLATKPGNDDNLIDLTAAGADTKVRIFAPGKIGELKVTFVSGAPELKNYIERRTTGSSDTIDLVGDSKVVDQFDGLPTGKDVEGKTDLTIEFSFVSKNLVDWSNGTNVFTVQVKDQNGKEAGITVKLQK
ncbi:MAG: hypothetical protein IKZ91_01815 [Bacteroidales bacterium]|nr:hypothetical protein [Bacteroidales bacterium]